MGTNYYVRIPACANACEHCGAAVEVHLGKSSGGWRFLHRAYPLDAYRPEVITWPVIDRESWLKLLDLGPIFDEYGSGVARAEFLAFVDRKQDQIAHDSAAARELGGPYYTLDHDFVSDGYDFCDVEFS